MNESISKILTGGLRFFFQLLYHEFAWTYDWVAWVVSVGRWKEWVLSTLPYLEGPEILEIGHGPGHLQVALQRKGIHAYGLDESWQMGHQAYQRLMRAGLTSYLVCGYAQSMPFSSQQFSRVVATFPSEYIFTAEAVHEIFRILTPGGSAVILPGAIITGSSIPDRLARLLFRVTAQAPSDMDKTFITLFTTPFRKQGFSVEAVTIHLRSSQVLLVVARKPILN